MVSFIALLCFVSIAFKVSLEYKQFSLNEFFDFRTKVPYAVSVANWCEVEYAAVSLKRLISLFDIYGSLF